MAHDLALTTEDGITLVAEVDVPAGASRIAVLTHPHPLYGGDMHNLVPDTLFRVLPSAGVGALRFNFRGAGGSGGVHDGGAAEQLDIDAALDAAAAVAGITSLVAVGYSFGADVLLAVSDDRLDHVVVVAPPLALLRDDVLRGPRGQCPTTMLCPEHDQFRPADAAAAHVADWPGTTVDPIPGADHFLAGRSAWLGDRVTDLLRVDAGQST